MTAKNDLIVRDILERFCLTAKEPLAVFEESGKLHCCNEAMRSLLDQDSDPETLLQAFFQHGQDAAGHFAGQHKDGKTAQLVKLGIGDIGLVTVVERLDDDRIRKLQQKLEEAEKDSITDRLTGVWNRRQFEQVARRELMRAQRYGEALSLAIVDIDHFKHINDEYGHAIGDRVLKELIERIRSQIRVVDSLFRWGGEEFAVLLPHTPQNGARLSAERLRVAVAEREFPIVGPVTVSVGVAELGAGETGEAWFKRADDALYEAKNAGRNCVVCSTRPGLASPAQAGQDEPVFMPWKSSYECGHPLIDSQHKQLFVLGDRLISASLSDHTGHDEFLALVDELIAHVIQHFADEEHVLNSIGYAELPAHHRAHSALVDKARQLRHKAEHGTATANEVIDFLVNSVVKNHMLTADKAFFEYLTPDSWAAQPN